MGGVGDVFCVLSMLIVIFKSRLLDSKLQTAAKGIAPGTLWCGLDDIATEYSSLGSDQELDK